MKLNSRLKEPSTYAGLFSLLGLFGLNIPTDLGLSVGQVMISFVSLFEIIRRER